MAISASYNNALWDEDFVNHLGICPAGWHLPTYEEWQTLVEYVATNYADDGNNDAGTMLKATSGWSHSRGVEDGPSVLVQGNGLDAYGFAAVPSGIGYNGVYEVIPGGQSCWWTTFQGNATSALGLCMGSLGENVGGNTSGDPKATKFSIRCIED